MGEQEKTTDEAAVDEGAIGGAPANHAIKMLSEDDGGATVGGYMALWGDDKKRDLQGDYFTPTTQTWHEHYKAVPALFHHGLDEAVGADVIGHRVKAAPDDVGLWVEDWLDKSSKYWGLVKPLLAAEALYYSPGSAPHLVKREDDGRLLSWPIVEDTLTPTPAQHRLRPVGQIKAAYKAAGLEVPEEFEEGGDTSGDVCQESDESEKDGLKARARALALRARMGRQQE